jgi:hypothetical protein
MKNFFKLLGIATFVVAIGLSMVGCATTKIAGNEQLNGTMVDNTPNGIWTDHRSGLVLTFTDNYAVFSEVYPGTENGDYLNALKNGIIKIGDKGFRNITRTGNMNWTCQAISITGHWGDIAFTMDVNGKFFTLSNGYTYTKGGW